MTSNGKSDDDASILNFLAALPKVSEALGCRASKLVSLAK